MCLQARPSQASMDYWTWVAMFGNGPRLSAMAASLLVALPGGMDQSGKRSQMWSLSLLILAWFISAFAALADPMKQ